MPAKLTAVEQNLVKVFSDDYFFEIPFYQRPYAWTTEQVDELLDDLTDAMEPGQRGAIFPGKHRPHQKRRYAPEERRRRRPTAL